MPSCLIRIERKPEQTLAEALREFAAMIEANPYLLDPEGKPV